MQKFQSSKKYGWSFIFIAILLLFIAVFAIHFLRHRAPPHHLTTIQVKVATVITKAMPVELKLPGLIEPAQSVNVKSQVTGIIKKIAFGAGQTVQAGQLLFEIEPTPFNLALAQAEQNLIKDQAQLTNTEKNQQRLAILVKKGYVSKQTYDQIVAQANMQTATVHSDQEAVKAAKIQLSYTQIKAPIAGKTGNVTLKEGDLITAEATTPMVTINQLNPVLVNFNLPQNELPKLLIYKKTNPIIMKVYSEIGKQLLGKGQLSFIDNAVNPQTGTILLKGLVANTNHLLWPSQMVKVKLILTTENNAIVIPSQAVRNDDNGPFVYAVVNNKALVQRITVARQENKLIVVKSGLNVGEQIVVAAPPNIENGSQLRVES